QLNDVICREGVADIPPHGGQDHVGRPPVAREGGRRVCSEILSTRAASVPLPPAGIIAIALHSRLLTTWTANHRPGSLLSTKQIRKLGKKTGTRVPIYKLCDMV